MTNSKSNRISRLKQYSLFGMVLLLCVLFLYGVSIPRDFDVYGKVGFFVTRPYRYGMYLSQQNTDIFYNISPYQSYYLDSSGNKEYLMKWDNPIFSKESQLIYTKTKRYETLVHSVLSYLQISNPKATFSLNNQNLTLKTSISGQRISFIVSNNTISPQNGRDLYLTLSYNKEDIIYNNNEEVFSVETTAEDMTEMNKVLGTNLHPAESYESLKTGTYIYLFNKSLNNTIKIPTQNTSQEFTRLNLEDRLLEFKILPNKLQDSGLEIEIEDIKPNII